MYNWLAYISGQTSPESTQSVLSSLPHPSTTGSLQRMSLGTDAAVRSACIATPTPRPTCADERTAKSRPRVDHEHLPNQVLIAFKHYL
jgi:hypothetical protein